MDDLVFVDGSGLCEINMAKFDCVGVDEHFGGRVNDLEAAVMG